MWGVMLDCGVRECSYVMLSFEEQWERYKVVRGLLDHNQPFGMRVNGQGTICY